MSNATLDVNTESIISEKLEAFDEALANHEFLEIDGDYEECGKQYLKILNHNIEEAFRVSVDDVIKQKHSVIIRALETGVNIRLHGMTRIVGFYTRFTEWNRSKRAEHQARRRGNYVVHGKVNGSYDNEAIEVLERMNQGITTR